MMSAQTSVIKENKKTSCCCAGKDQVRSEGTDRNVPDPDLPLHKLTVVGATCGGCVGKIERALQSVAGVEEARMNLSAGIAFVSGDVATETLVCALKKNWFLGYKNRITRS